MINDLYTDEEITYKYRLFIRLFQYACLEVVLIELQVTCRH